MANVGFVVPDHTVLVSDGGLATELEARGYVLQDVLPERSAGVTDLWSARLLIDAPDAIVAAHTAFFRAGAMIATTASYQASFDGFAARGIDRAETEVLLRRSVELARSAARDGTPHWVAASIGPYGATLGHGAEYRGRYGMSVPDLTAWHRPRLDVLADAGPDLLACETIPDIDEALALADLVSDVDLPAWLSYSIDGQRTRAGQPLAEAFAVAAEVPQIVAVGVNCCAPADVLPAIGIAREVTGKPVVVYPNSGERWEHGHWAGQRSFAADLVPQWIAAGARIIGGCCRVRPADIAAVAHAVAAGAVYSAPARTKFE